MHLTDLYRYPGGQFVFKAIHFDLCILSITTDTHFLLVCL